MLLESESLWNRVLDKTLFHLETMRLSAKTPKPKKRRKTFFVGLCVIVFLLLGDYCFYPLLGVGGRSFNKGENGSWLHFSWYFGNHSEPEVRALAQQLNANQIRYAYFHVRFIQKDGRLRFHYPAAAQQLNRVLERAAPQTKSIAWIYIGNERGLTGVNIADVKVRANIVREARWLIDVCGFGGVQIDYEMCEDGDTVFLHLLREMRAALPKDKLLSVATPMWLPSAFHAWGWSENYFAKVASNCDQIVVMGYDSALFFPRHYVWLMRQQAIRVTRAVASGNARCRVLVGVPTYKDGGISHHLHAENLRMALKGVREGLTDERAKLAVFAGVAIFSNDSTTREEWQTYRNLWLKSAAS